MKAKWKWFSDIKSQEKSSPAKQQWKGNQSENDIRWKFGAKQKNE